MGTQVEIITFIDQADPNKLKDYYDKCYSTLKDINKRSNLISFFIIILLAFVFFPSYVRETEVIGIKINEGVVDYFCPLLIPYFILEWCLLARRKRELIIAMKYASYKLFDIAKPSLELPFPFISPLSRNGMPFSFMVEISNVDSKSRLNNTLTRLAALILLVTGLIFLCYLAYHSFSQYLIPFPMIVCNCLGIYCTIRIFLFYISEFRELRSNN